MHPVERYRHRRPARTGPKDVFTSFGPVRAGRYCSIPLDDTRHRSRAVVFAFGSRGFRHCPVKAEHADLSATGAAQADQIAQLTGQLSARQDQLQAGPAGRIAAPSAERSGRPARRRWPTDPQRQRRTAPRDRALGRDAPRRAVSSPPPRPNRPKGRVHVLWAGSGGAVAIPLDECITPRSARQSFAFGSRGFRHCPVKAEHADLSATGAAQADQIAQLTGQLSARQDQLQAGPAGRITDRQLAIWSACGAGNGCNPQRLNEPPRGIER